VRLRALTGAFVLFSLALMVAYPWILGPKPTTKLQLHGFAIRYLIYLTVIVCALLAAGFTSILILRKAREEYRLEKEELMRQLLEATLRDQQKGRSGAAE